ncbi:MAG: type II secretion system F family protein [Sutterellaceae bacterium]|nr:type II secretion system F family protein [Sutterellaceae bacterium]
MTEKSFLIVLLLSVIVLCVIVNMLMQASRREKQLKSRLRTIRSGAGMHHEDESGFRLPARLRLPEAQCAAATCLISLALVGYFGLNVWLSGALVVLSTVLVWFVVKQRRLARLRKAFLSRFPESVDSFARSIKAGIPLERALSVLGTSVGGELGRRYLKLTEELKVGLPFRECLHNFSDEVDDPDVDFFCGVLALTRETGSPLSPMLATFSEMLRERKAVDRKLEGLTAESRASARVLCLLPLFLMGLEFFLNPSHLYFLVNDPTGRIVTGACLAVIVCGFLIIQRMSRSLEG